MRKPSSSRVARWVQIMDEHYGVPIHACPKHRKKGGDPLNKKNAPALPVKASGKKSPVVVVKKGGKAPKQSGYGK